MDAASCRTLKQYMGWPQSVCYASCVGACICGLNSVTWGPCTCHMLILTLMSLLPACPSPGPVQMLHVDAGSRKEPGPLPVNPALDKYRALPGVQVEVSAIPYNPAMDCALSTLSQQAIAEDIAWERLRGTEQYLAWRVREKQALELLPRGMVNEADSGSSSSNTGGSRDIGHGGSDARSSRALRRSRSRQLLQAR